MSSYIAPEYVPTAAVMQIHSLPRFDATTLAQSTHVNFALTNIDEMSDVNAFTSGDGTATSKYLTGVATLPLAMIVVGILSVIIMQIVMFLRICCPCFFGRAPKEDDLVNKPELIIKRRNHAVFGFWLFMFAMVLTAHLLYFPAGDLDTGVESVTGVLDELKIIFGSAAASLRGNILQVEWVTGKPLYDLAQYLIGENCGTNAVDFAQNLEDTCEATTLQFTTFAELLEGVEGSITGMKDSVTLFGGDYKDLGLYGMYGFILSIVIVFGLGCVFSSKFIMFVGMLIGEVVCIVFTLYCSVTMIIVILYADFCTNPADNMMKLLNGMDMEFGESTVGFFATCEGDDPFLVQFDTLYGMLEKFTGPYGYLTDIGDICIDNGADQSSAGFGYIATSRAALGSGSSPTGVFGGMEDVQASFACSSVNPVYDGFINKAFCTNTFNGLYKIWGVALLANVFLFFVMAYSSVMWQYFGVAWKLKPTSKHHGTHHQLDGSALAPSEGGAAYEAPVGYKQEYTFTAASPAAPTLTRRDIEMI